jgi:16S rRNA (guanine(966)-N(2))-methyltransferase RsmD
MRISAGRLKGLSIDLPKGIRPTQDKVKNAVFNILQDAVKDARFLELFAGSGLVGFEALSRGAKEVILVENSLACVKSVEETIRKISPKITDQNIKILQQESLKTIEQFHSQGEKFDIVFADPPYFEKRAPGALKQPADWPKKTLQTLGRCDIINPLGLVIIQSRRKEALDQSYESLALLRSYNYGDTSLRVYSKE